MRGRKAIDPNEKKQLVRVFVKKKVINAFTNQEMEIEISKFINQLQTQALDKCVAENLKKDDK